MKTITAFLLLCATTFGAAPVAKIIGPTTARPGAIVILSVEGVKPKHIKWRVDASQVQIPKDGAAEALEATAVVLREAGYSVQLPPADAPQIYLVLDDSRRLLLSSYVGTYKAKLVVGNDDGVDDVEHQVVVSGTLPIPVPVPVPIPTPIPTPIPVPVPIPSDVAAKITAAVKAAPVVEFNQVADAYVRIADQIKGGLLSTPQQVNAFTSVLVPIAAGTHAAEWAKIDSDNIKPYLATASLTKASDYEPVWRMIAAAVKAGLVDIPPPVVVPPDVTPLPDKGLHVCIVEEMDDRSTLPASHIAIFSSSKFKGWLDQNGIKWRMFDDDVDQSKLDAVWKLALKKVSESGVKLPAIIVSNDTTGTIAPLPASEEAVQTLVEKFK